MNSLKNKKHFAKIVKTETAVCSASDVKQKTCPYYKKAFFQISSPAGYCKHRIGHECTNKKVRKELGYAN